MKDAIGENRKNGIQSHGKNVIAAMTESPVVGIAHAIIRRDGNRNEEETITDHVHKVAIRIEGRADIVSQVGQIVGSEINGDGWNDLLGFSPLYCSSFAWL